MNFKTLFEIIPVRGSNDDDNKMLLMSNCLTTCISNGDTQFVIVAKSQSEHVAYGSVTKQQFLGIFTEIDPENPDAYNMYQGLEYGIRPVPVHIKYLMSDGSPLEYVESKWTYKQVSEEKLSDIIKRGKELQSNVQQFHLI